MSNDHFATYPEGMLWGSNEITSTARDLVQRNGEANVRVIRD